MVVLRKASASRGCFWRIWTKMPGPVCLCEAICGGMTKPPERRRLAINIIRHAETRRIQRHTGPATSVNHKSYAQRRRENYEPTQQKSFSHSSPVLPAHGQPRVGGAAGHDNGNH